VWPEITALVLILVVGVWAVVTGALQIAAAIGVFAPLPRVALPWSPWQVRPGRAIVLRVGGGHPPMADHAARRTGPDVGRPADERTR
jgi:hypothetical protein